MRPTQLIDAPTVAPSAHYVIRSGRSLVSDAVFGRSSSALARPQTDAVPSLRAPTQCIRRNPGRRQPREELERTEAQRLADIGWVEWGGELIGPSASRRAARRRGGPGCHGPRSDAYAARHFGGTRKERVRGYRTTHVQPHSLIRHHLSRELCPCSACSRSMWFQCLAPGIVGVPPNAGSAESRLDVRIAISVRGGRGSAASVRLQPQKMQV